MRTFKFSMMIVLALMFCTILCTATSGCKIYMGKEAMTTVQASTAQSVEAARRINEDPNASDFAKKYSVENAKQWRWFVRTALGNLEWGKEYDAILDPPNIKPEE